MSRYDFIQVENMVNKKASNIQAAIMESAKHFE
jgi:hypothetical protein